MIPNVKLLEATSVSKPLAHSITSATICDFAGREEHTNVINAVANNVPTTEHLLE
jgi:hypothetical protein